VLLDEPTSGLDSAASYNIIKLIKKVAVTRGITVIATIHQPSSETYSLFDKLMLLANGNTMYFGERADALAYFEGHGFALPFAQNPADYYLDIINVY
jgi:ABC-type multidrug transport system ATPase subunit